MTGRLNPLLTFIFAALILVFTGGPVLLSLYGSLVPDRIMLDEFELHELAQAVAEAGGRVPLEVSGSVALERVRAIAETGVDYVSIGALTKNVRAIDLSMRIELIVA